MTVSTTDVSAGADPVVHVFDASDRQVAMDDNSGGGTAALLTYRASTTAPLYLLVRAKSAFTGGTATLVVTTPSGEARRSLTLGSWWAASMESLRAGERITTVRLPGAAGSYHTLFLMKPDGIGIEQRRVGNGVDDAADMYLTSAVGTRYVSVALRANGLTEQIRLVRNDVGVFAHDPDADGLGSELEGYVRTCSTIDDSVPGVNCRTIPDLRDTDGDGIADGLELVGTIRHDSAGRQVHLPLPRWGAKVRHKSRCPLVGLVLRTGKSVGGRPLTSWSRGLV